MRTQQFLICSLYFILKCGSMMDSKVASCTSFYLALFWIFVMLERNKITCNSSARFARSFTSYREQRNRFSWCSHRCPRLCHTRASYSPASSEGEEEGINRRWSSLLASLKWVIMYSCIIKLVAVFLSILLEACLVWKSPEELVVASEAASTRSFCFWARKHILAFY